MDTKPRPRVAIASLTILTVTIGCTGQGTVTQAKPEGSRALIATPPSTPGELTPVPSTSTATTGPPQEEYEGPGIMLLAEEGQEQAGGLGVYCVASPVTGYCVDRPITLPPDPIVLETNQEAVFRTTGDFNPVRLTLYIFENGANIPVDGAGERVWGFDLARDAIDALRKEALDPATETTFDLQLEPGEFVLILNGLWSQGEQSYDVTYGFTVWSVALSRGLPAIRIWVDKWEGVDSRRYPALRSQSDSRCGNCADVP